MLNELSISRKDLVEALKPLKTLVSRKDLAEAVLSMDEGMLCMAVVGVATYAAAEGTWMGEVRIPGSFLVGLAKMPPFEDPVVVAVRDGRLYFGSVSVGCVEQDAWKSEIQLPLDPSLPEILKLAFQYPAERIERAGLKKRVEEANERAADLLDKAATTLAPLGLTRKDLRDLLVKSLQTEK